MPALRLGFTVTLTPADASQVDAGASDLVATGTILNDDTNSFAIGDVSVNEAAGTMTFTVTRTGDSDVDITLNYATSDDSAVAGSDYTATTGSIIFPAGGSGDTQTFTVPILNDSVVEDDETFTVTLTPADASQVDAGASDLVATGTILNDDTNSFAIGDVSVNEAAGTMTFTVTRTGDSDVDITLNYATSDDSAVAGSDYTATTGSIIFPAGGSGDTQTFTVPILNDSVVEDDETFTVTLTPADASQVDAGASDLVATGTILNDDTNSFAIGDVSVNEAAGTMTFTVTRTGDSDVDITLNYATSDDSAVAGSDYTATTGSIIFPAGGSGDTQTFTVPILNDSVVEDDETFTVTLTPADASQVDAGASDLVATGTILNDDTNSFAIGDVSVNEAAGTMTFTVTRTGDSDVDITLNYATSDDSAVAGSDYTATTGSIIFPAGGSGDTQTFTVPILNDSVVEGDETFTVTLTPADASQVDAGASDLVATGTILNDDTNSFAIGDVSVNEAAGTMTFTVTRTGDSDVDITLNYATSDDSAVAGSDYTATTGSIMFPAGGSGDTQTFTVPILDDSVVEDDETFTVTLTPADASQVDAGASDLVATGTILNDDTNSFAIGDVSVNEAAGTMTFTVTRTGDSDVDITLNYATSDDSAVAGSDYTATTGSIMFPAGGSGDTQTFTVPILDDSVVEDDETFTVTLTPADASQVDAGASDLVATGTILNDDTNSFAIGDVSVNEAAGTMTFTVTRTGDSDVDITLNYATSDDSAVAGSDYTATTGSIMFPAGGSGDTQTFTVPILDDSVVEDDETFTVTLTPADASQVDAGASDLVATGTILNDDTNSFAIGDVSVNEAAGTMTFTVTRTGDSDVDITLNYATSDDSAVAGSDYTATTGSITSRPAAAATPRPSRCRSSTIR